MSEQRTHEEVRRTVREAYARTAKAGEYKTAPASGCCGPQAAPEEKYAEKPAMSSTGCCGPTGTASTAGTAGTAEKTTHEEHSRKVGYSAEDLGSIPEGADMGLGCGNPAAIAALQPGETVLDLGSGGGIDCFLASAQVGVQGRVIGVDMTPEMVSKARANIEKTGAENVSFRLGEIEHLPVEDASVNVVISNCVINLSPDKPAVYREAFRVLKPGGRLAISDIVVTAPLPEAMREDKDLLTGCVAGAATIDDIEAILAEVGFDQVRITPKDESRSFIRDWVPGRKLEDVVLSAVIEAVKPVA